jgi:hypothetical protein
MGSGIKTSQEAFYMQVGDTLCLKTNVKTGNHKWVMIKPENKAYELTDARQYFEILYNVKSLSNTSDSLLVCKYAVKAGTYYFACLSKDTVLSDTFSETIPPDILFSKRIVRVTIRDNNSYLGYLTELMNVPFTLPPRYLQGIGHQTDLCQGTDCAELAIYGKRRQGYNIPYCGPMHISDYLDKIPVDSIFAGCVVHFGDQVCVIYKDSGINGILEKDDLLIQSYTNGTEIISWENSGFFNRNYFAYKWKKQYE